VKDLAGRPVQNHPRSLEHQGVRGRKKARRRYGAKKEKS